MDSVTLKNQKAAFEKSVLEYCEKYHEMIKKIEEIDIMLEESDDNLLYHFLLENNKKTKEKITDLLNNVEIYKKNTVKKVEQKIWELEEIERLEREKKLKEMNLEEEM